MRAEGMRRRLPALFSSFWYFDLCVLADFTLSLWLLSYSHIIVLFILLHIKLVIKITPWTHEQLQSDEFDTWSTLDTNILVAEKVFTKINFTENFSQKATILQFKATILVGEKFSQQAIP